ncbi:MAG TPA: formate hydrogenlyase maturation protein HycH [Anaerolineales bacterium]|nr:formate hydrogenlyase maturation protein HycH [Anaerolineales bacterium]
MVERAVIYQLNRKYVNNEQDIPDEARQVIYYSLAIGHHVGVLDCLQRLMEIQLDEYRNWIDLFPEGSGRHKLEGLLKWGEIEVNRSHTRELLPLLNGSLDLSNSSQKKWTNLLIQQLNLMEKEPAIYLMLRKCL